MAKRTTSTATVRVLKQIFARMGNPDVLVSDKGTQIVSAESKKFCEKQGIKHMRTPAYHFQSIDYLSGS